jgi:hypothetical protein
VRVASLALQQADASEGCATVAMRADARAADSDYRSIDRSIGWPEGWEVGWLVGWGDRVVAVNSV